MTNDTCEVCVSTITDPERGGCPHGRVLCTWHLAECRECRLDMGRGVE